MVFSKFTVVKPPKSNFGTYSSPQKEDSLCSLQSHLQCASSGLGTSSYPNRKITKNVSYICMSHIFHRAYLYQNTLSFIWNSYLTRNPVFPTKTLTFFFFEYCWWIYTSLFTIPSLVIKYAFIRWLTKELYLYNSSYINHH